MARINEDPSKQHLVEQFNNTFNYLDDSMALNNNDFIFIVNAYIL